MYVLYIDDYQVLFCSHLVLLENLFLHVFRVAQGMPDMVDVWLPT